MTGAGTTRTQGNSQSSFKETAEANSADRPAETLDQVELRLLADFFLLLDKWDTLQSTQVLVESPDKREVA